jgi:hypothetical protein
MFLASILIKSLVRSFVFVNAVYEVSARFIHHVFCILLVEVVIVEESVVVQEVAV